MSYFTASAVADMPAVFGYIVNFIASLPGWTVDLAPSTPQTAPTVGGQEYIAHNKGCLIGLRTIDSGPMNASLFLLDGVGPYTGGNVGSLNGDSGIGPYAYTFANLTSNSIGLLRGIYPQSTNVVNGGPYPNIFLFSNAAGDYVHCVLQIDSANFRHMLFGNITKYGTWANAALGGYFAGTYWNFYGYPDLNHVISSPSASQHGVPFQAGQCNDGEQLDWTVNYANGRAGDTAQWLAPELDTNSFGGTGVARRQASGSVRGGFNRMFKNIQQSLFTGLVPMGPVIISSYNQNVSPNTVCPVGEIPDFRMINMATFSDAQEFLIGTDTWKVFSVAAKNGANGQVNSGDAGFAYKKIA